MYRVVADTESLGDTEHIHSVAPEGLGGSMALAVLEHFAHSNCSAPPT